MIKTALIVEDCPLTIEMTRFCLQKLGITKILTVNDHVSFEVLIAQNVVPDLVITDWHIGSELSGGDVISKMSKYNVPIAVLSSQDRIINYNQSFQYPWFKKPLNFADFKNWLQIINV